MVGARAVIAGPVLDGTAALVRTLAEPLAGLRGTATGRATTLVPSGRGMASAVARGSVPATDAAAVRGECPGGTAGGRGVERPCAGVRARRVATRTSDGVVSRRTRAVARRPDRSLTGSGAGSCATEAAAEDRLGSDARIGLEARDDLGRDRAPEDAFDVGEQPHLVDADQRDGVAVDAGAPGPADPVDVVLGDHRQLEVDDVRERIDVEAARGDLGRDEDRELGRP